MKKKRIRFLINSLSGGGAENILMNVLRHLSAKQDYDISLVTVVGGDLEKRIPAAVRYRKILKRDNGLFKLFVKLVLKLPRRLFAALFLRGEYDFEVAYLEGRPTRFAAAKKTSGKKIAFVHCDMAVANPVLPLYRSTAACLEEYRGFDSVCFVSADALNSFERVIGSLDNARIIHNIIDAERIVRLSEADTKPAFSTSGLKLVAVGRLAPEKNYGMLVSVVGELSRDYETELLLIGDGPERSALEAQIRENELSCVKLLGYSDNPYPVMKQADLLVCSSLYEGYSTVVCESLTLGVPVITTDCAGMTEILNDGRYGMITENSREGLLRGLKSLLTKPAVLERFAANLGDYSADPVADREYAALFEE